MRGKRLGEPETWPAAARVLNSLVLWYKLRLEEQWMRTQFGAPYEAYSRRTAALVPFVL